MSSPEYFQRNLDKRDKRKPLELAEVRFIAERAHDTYAKLELPFVSIEPIYESIKLSDEFINIIADNRTKSAQLRNHSDRSHFIRKKVNERSNTDTPLDGHVSTNVCEFASRDLSRALQAVSNSLSTTKLNEMIEGSIDVIIAVACRSFWLGEEVEAPSDFLEYRISKIPPDDYSKNQFYSKDKEKNYLKCVDNNCGKLNGFLYLEENSMFIYFNSFFELEELAILTRRYTDHKETIQGKKFTIFDVDTTGAHLSIPEGRIIVTDNVIKNIYEMLQELRDWDRYKRAERRFGVI